MVFMRLYSVIQFDVAIPCIYATFSSFKRNPKLSCSRPLSHGLAYVINTEALCLTQLCRISSSDEGEEVKKLTVLMGLSGALGQALLK